MNVIRPTSPVLWSGARYSTKSLKSGVIFLALYLIFLSLVTIKLPTSVCLQTATHAELPVGFLVHISEMWQKIEAARSN